jgi:hypothetical protein
MKNAASRQSRRLLSLPIYGCRLPLWENQSAIGNCQSVMYRLPSAPRTLFNCESPVAP